MCSMTHEYDITVLGGGAVGKSALTIQFIQSMFVEDYDPTIEDSYRKHAIIDDEVALLDILDTAGQAEYFDPPTSLWFGNGFLLVYSIGDKNSFQEISHLYKTVLRVKESPTVPMLLVGNKSDLEYERLVSYGQGERLAESLGIKFIETSAKNRVNVDEAFYEQVREIRKHQKTAAEPKHRRGKCSLL